MTNVLSVLRDTLDSPKMAACNAAVLIEQILAS